MIVGGVVLDYPLVVNGLHDSNTTVSSVEYDIQGVPFVYISKRDNLNIVEFTSTENTGWQRYDTVKLLKELERNSDIFDIEKDGNIYTCSLVSGIMIDKVFKTIPDGHENDWYKVNFKCIIIEGV